MANTHEEVDLPWYQKVLALGAVVVIVVLLFVVGAAIFGSPSQQEKTDQAIQSCGASKFSYETDCPEPDYDKDLYDEVNKHPDNSY